MANEIRRAYHEAGHLVMAICQRVPIGGATILPPEDYTGGIIRGLEELLNNIEWDTSDDVVTTTEKYIRVCMGGGCSERLWKFGGFRVAHVQIDHKLAVDLLNRICVSNEFDTYWKSLDLQTTNLLKEHWEFIEYVVHQLMEHKRLGDEQCQQLLSDFVEAKNKPNTANTWDDLPRNMRFQQPLSTYTSRGVI